MRDKFHPNCGLVLLVTALVWLVFNSACWAVSSKITRHSSSADLLKGEAKDIVIGSQGTIQLGRAAEVLVDFHSAKGGSKSQKRNTQYDENVWSINSIVVSGGTVFVGTSPDGGIYKYSLGELTKIYPL